MSEYVHLNIICLDGKSLWISFNMGFRNKNDIRCFDCIPWGNKSISSQFTRVGKLLK